MRLALAAAAVAMAFGAALWIAEGRPAQPPRRPASGASRAVALPVCPKQPPSPEPAAAAGRDVPTAPAASTAAPTPEATGAGDSPLVAAALRGAEEARAAAVAGLAAEGRYDRFLRDLYDTDPSPVVRLEVVRALGADPSFLRTVIRGDRHADVRRFAAELARTRMTEGDVAWLEWAGDREADAGVRSALAETARLLRPRR